jgi:hypothetical protein
MQWRRQGKLSADLGRLEKTLESGDAAKSPKGDERRQ